MFCARLFWIFFFDMGINMDLEVQVNRCILDNNLDVEVQRIAILNKQSSLRITYGICK